MDTSHLNYHSGTFGLKLKYEAAIQQLYTKIFPCTLSPPSLSCFIQNNVTFYVSVVGYAVLIFLFNIAVNNLTVSLKGHTTLPHHSGSALP